MVDWGVTGSRMHRVKNDKEVETGGLGLSHPQHPEKSECEPGRFYLLEQIML